MKSDVHYVAGFLGVIRMTSCIKTSLESDDQPHKNVTRISIYVNTLYMYV
jgi:hypothetical protein